MNFNCDHKKNLQAVTQNFVQAEEVMEETISEPNFDIEVASSDYDHDMENFDQQAGLQSSGVHTSETEKSEGTDTGGRFRSTVNAKYHT